MVSNPKQCHITEEDLRAARADLKGYVDITEEDLMKIYSSALRYARTRTMVAIPVSDLMTRDVVTIDPDADLKEAARRLSGLRISACRSWTRTTGSSGSFPKPIYCPWRE